MKNNYFQNIVFPVIFYDLTYKYPPYKILENRILNFSAFESFEDLIADPDSIYELKSLFRMIDSEGNHYSTIFSKDFGFNVPSEIIGQLSIDEIRQIMEPWTKQLQNFEIVKLNNYGEITTLITEIIQIESRSA